MANALYDNGRNEFLLGNIAWTTDALSVVLVDTGAYTLDLATHTSLADIPVGARVATATLTTPTAANGTADADDVVFPTVSGSPSEALVIYKDTGVEATSTLIAYIDTATGLPVTPNGGDVNVTWDAGANKIFTL